MITNAGQFLLFLAKLFSNREKFNVYTKLIIDECVLIGVDSIFIVVIISTFIGGVTAIQTAHSLTSPFVPLYIIGVITRDMTVLELAPTFTGVILAGKIGSSIAGNIGTMRITEQIDALEVMGINSASYLVLPKIIAGMIMFPLLTVIAGFLALYGGYLAAVLTGVLTSDEYIYGIRFQFESINVLFALIKAFIFGFLITSISAYQGYITRGGSLEVGKASTNAVTNSCIAVLIADYVVAQLLMS
jgi:phospholipid/cholesterol/gamma-HCH transport system permease protein